MSAYDRWYRLGDKRNELLALWEAEQYGRDSFGHQLQGSGTSQA